MRNQLRLFLQVTHPVVFHYSGVNRLSHMISEGLALWGIPEVRGHG